MALMRRNGKYLLVGLVFVFICWVLVNWQNSFNLLPSQVKDRSLDLSVRKITTAAPKIWREHDSSGNRKCPSVSGMTEGRWVVRPLNETEQMMVDTYLREARAAYKIPPTFQRDDGRCGDATYSNVTLHKHMWFRAICDPRGATPCCYTNSCQPLTQEDCRCPTCLDERQAVHAEFAHWQPTDDRCPVIEFNTDLACQLLDGMSLYFVGDSFIRHMFAALVILLTNEVDGAMKEDIPREIKGRCQGHNQITAEVCRAYLDPVRALCYGKVKVQYVEMFSVVDLPVIHRLLVALRQSSNSLVVMGLGIHNNFNPTVVSKKFLYPFLNLRQHLSTNLSAEPDIQKLMRIWDILGWSPSTSNVIKPEVTADLKNTSSYSRKRDTNFGNGQTGGSTHPQLVIAKDQRSKVKYESNKRNMKDAYHRQAEGNHVGESLLADLYQKYAADLTSSSAFLQAEPTPGIDLTNLRPRILWVGAHAPGLLKSARFPQQSADGVQRYNSEISHVLKRWRVPVLDTFSFSNGTVSFDGTHYGWGINKLKANMLLTYIRTSFSGDGRK